MNVNSVPIRTIEVSNDNLSIENKIEKFQEKFDIVETAHESGISYVNAKINFKEIELLNTSYEGQEVTTSFMAQINHEEDRFVVESELVANNNVENQDSLEYVTEYDEQLNKFYLVDYQGNKIDIINEIEESDVE